MSIEVSPPSNEPQKSSASSSAQSGKAKGKAGVHGAPGGFNAILGALDDGPATAGTAATAAALLTDPAKDVPLAASPLDASAMLAQNPQIPGLLPVPAAVALVPAPAKAEGDAAVASASLPGAGKGKSAPVPAGGKPSELSSDAGDAAGKAAPGNAAHARTLAATSAAADASANAAASNASNSAAHAAPDTRDTRMAAALELMKAVQAAPLAEQPVPLSGIAKSEKSTGERISSASQNADTSYVAAPVGSNGSFADNASAPGGVTPAPEVQVAEQVKYWMSHDVQNAELKLDGLGKDPVQVSISMTGNEAHIAFRTDETQARGLLEGAAAHLKDMLGREGVVLTGVSVGTSGSQSDTGGERRPRQGVRQAFVTPPIGALAATGSRAPVSSGRALDLFV